MEKLIDLGAGCFENATVDVNILFYRKKEKDKKYDRQESFKAASYNGELNKINEVEFNNEIVLNKGHQWIIMNKSEKTIFEKINKHKPLKDWNVKINIGIITGFNEAFIIDEDIRERLIKEDKKSAEIIKPLLRGRDIKRYSYNFNGLYLINTHNGIKEKNIPPIDINNYKDIKKHLDKYYTQLEKRQDKGITPYNLRDCAYYKDFEKPKLIYPETTTSANFYYDDIGIYLDATAFFMTGRHLKYIMAVLYSKAGFYIFYHFYSNIQLGSEGFQYRKDSIEPLPIPKPDKDSEDKLINLVDAIIDLNKKLDSEKNPNSANMLNVRIKEVDKNIDRIVYSLYNLTDEEINN